MELMRNLHKKASVEILEEERRNKLRLAISEASQTQSDKNLENGL